LLISGEKSRMKSFLFFQLAYFLFTGIWPLVHIRSFMKVTGPKTDLWLVRTVALLVLSISFGIAVGLIWNGTSTLVLAGTSAFFLFAIDIYYVTRGVISRIYLADAFLEMVFVVN